MNEQLSMDWNLAGRWKIQSLKEAALKASAATPRGATVERCDNFEPPREVAASLGLFESPRK